jgi:DNA-binding FrmR family transcriptional regulator
LQKKNLKIHRLTRRYVQGTNPSGTFMKRVNILFFLFALGGCAMPPPPVKSHETALSSDYYGSFRGDLITKALDDGRRLELIQPYAFEDAAGKLWGVPAKTVVDGASIPQAFWSVTGGPFSGKYRNASVIHDHYCVEKTDTWKNVHLVFYNAMRANEVDPIKAKLMYAAVYNYGPRWIGVALEDKQKIISGSPILLDDAKNKIIEHISENDPSISEINEMSDRLSKIENIEQLENLLYEHANCTPILTQSDASNTAVSEDVKRTIILCGLSDTSKEYAAIINLKILVSKLNKILHAQRYFLLPIIDEYVDSPTSKRWDEITEWSLNTYGLVKVGIRSVLDINDSELQTISPQLDDVFGVLTQRAVMLSPILSGPPKSKEEMASWVSNYRILVAKLESKLVALENRLVELEH